MKSYKAVNEEFKVTVGENTIGIWCEDQSVSVVRDRVIVSTVDKLPKTRWTARDLYRLEIVTSGDVGSVITALEFDSRALAEAVHMAFDKAMDTGVGTHNEPKMSRNDALAALSDDLENGPPPRRRTVRVFVNGAELRWTKATASYDDFKVFVPADAPYRVIDHVGAELTNGIRPVPVKDGDRFRVVVDEGVPCAISVNQVPTIFHSTTITYEDLSKMVGIAHPAITYAYRTNEGISSGKLPDGGRIRIYEGMRFEVWNEEQAAATTAELDRVEAAHE